MLKGERVGCGLKPQRQRSRRKYQRRKVGGHSGPSSRGCSCHQAVNRRRLLPMSSGSLSGRLCQGSHNPGPTPWGNVRPASDGGNLPQGPGTVGTPHTALAVSAVPLALLSATEQVSPNKWVFSPPRVWVENRRWRENLKAEAGPKPEQNARGYAH